MKIQQSKSARSKHSLSFYMVITAVLSLLPVSSHAAVFWDDEMEPGNTGYGTVMPTTGGFDNTVKFSGAASLREDFNGTTQGGFEDRTLPATDDLWSRFYIRLSPGFVVANQTKIMRNDTNTGLMHWWGMLFGGRSVTVQLQNYPTNGDTVNFYPNVGDGILTDNQWICIETRIKNNTVGQADGIVEAYKNGALFMYHAGLEIRKASQGTQNAQFVSNRMYRQAGTGSIWYDRVALGNTRIGCLGSAPTNDTIPPASPNGLIVR
ncbi:MAG: hypothetical protein K2X00_14375 [Nitrospiraceae bacterium]|nr:hypothetical protein [Nitrospiraceae bacterium]